MRLVYDLVDNLRAVNLAARQVLDPNNVLRVYLPVENVQDIRYRLEQVQRVDVAGAVRAFGTPSRQIRRPTTIELKGGLPAVSAMLSLTEGDLYKARMLAGIGQGDSLQLGVNSAAAATALAVDNAYELLRGAVLATGVLAIDNGEVIQSASFGVDPLNLLAAPTAWTVSTADIVNDLVTWGDRWTASAGGASAGVILTSRRNRSLMLRNTGIRNLFAANGVVPAIIGQNRLNEMLDAEFALPPILTYERIIDGQRVIPENRFIFLPATDTRMGSTTLGITEQAVQLAANGVLTANDVPGVSVATLVEDHPVARHVNADSIGLPVLQRPELLVSATTF